ncbi:MAG: hypothetical protein KGR98_05795 [Verrucomicrobia bacterium]|nr:hypothetical protein [Verrucomicrobiota bacterium]MDE3098075.1 hypothetical protein [Verrucomicrobiota bacterium]
MTEAEKSLQSLRPNRLEVQRLLLVLAFSLLAHLTGIGGYEIAKMLHFLPVLFARSVAAPPQQSPEQPLEFVMVQQPSTRAPAKTRYYGAANSIAADQSHKNLNKPELKGAQVEVARTETAPRPAFNRLQPQPAPVAAPRQPQSPVPAQPGDLTLPAPVPKPRPLKLSQVERNVVPGLEMRQSGGARRVALVPAFDVRETPFGAYDEAFIEAVTQRWYDLLDSRQFALDRTGKVVVTFHLHYDGTISDMQILDNTVGILLGQVCEDAINEPAPYAPWPGDMRRMVGATFRQITFTFYYY